MLKIKNLQKRYDNGVQALKGIDLEVPAGMFGLLGPNGAGKSTLMKIAATLLEPDTGEIEIDGNNLLKDKRATRQLLGYLPQQFGFYPVLTAEQTLNYFARLKGVTDKKARQTLIATLLERVNLTSVRGQAVGGFSGGMQQRLGIAQALIGQPKLIIVDEPTAGLDPEERVRFHNLLAEIASEKTTVILSTHIVADVANLCSRLAIIQRGEIIAATTPQSALAEIDGQIWEATISREQFAQLKTDFRIISSQPCERQIRVRLYARDSSPSPEFNNVAPTLEDYYFSRTTPNTPMGAAQ